MTAPLRLAVLISGSGRTLQNLIAEIAAGTLDARIVAVVASKPEATGRTFALAAGIPVAEIHRADFPGPKAYGRAVDAALAPHAPDLIVLAGFIHYLALPDRWRGHVVNIHPALLPRFGGRGMYGDRVHAAVLAAGESESGCTVHRVDDVYDHGAILLQMRVPVLPGDTPATLGARVFEAEKQAYPEALRRLISERTR